MIESLKRLTKHSAVYGIGHIITRLVNFLLLPLYTNQIPPDQFGAAAVVFTFLAFMTIIYSYGVDAAFLRYFILSDDRVSRRRIFSTAFWAVSVVALFSSALIYLNAVEISSLILSQSGFGALFRLSSVILLFDTLAFLPFLYLRAEERSVRYVVLKFINVVINIGLNIWFIVGLGMGVEGIFLANAWASGVTFLLVTPILLREIGFLFDRDAYAQLLRFGLPYLPSILAVVALDLVDRFILERMAGLEVTGIYQAGYKLGMFMSLFVAAFRFAWHPFFLSTSKQADAPAVFSKVLTYFTAAGAGLFLMISLFIDEIVRLRFSGFTLFGPEYWPGTAVVPIILLSYLIYGIYINFAAGLHVTEKTQYLPFVTGAGAAVNVAANLVLIPRFGMMGSAYATLLGYGVMAVSVYFVTRRFYPVPYELGRLLKLAAVVAVLFYLGSRASGAAAELIKVAVVLGLPGGLLLIGFFERRELEIVRNLITGKLGWGNAD